MIIAHPENWYVRTHANLRKTKAYHIIEGEMLMVFFDRNGRLLSSAVLSKECPVVRIEKGVFLFLWVLSGTCIFQEIALGPFERDSDTVFADFAPAVEDVENVQNYVSKVLELVNYGNK